MALHNTLGRQAEELAVKWLEQRGYEILHRNWRYSHYEIDVVALKNKMLHIIEVKARKTYHSCTPEESVTKKKFKNLQKAANEFLFQYPGYRWIQYDILSINIHPNRDPDYFLLEDVFL